MDFKVLFLVAYDSGESFETEMVEEARFAKDAGATVLEIRRFDAYVGKVHVEVKLTHQW